MKITVEIVGEDDVSVDVEADDNQLAFVVALANQLNSSGGRYSPWMNVKGPEGKLLTVDESP